MKQTLDVSISINQSYNLPRKILLDPFSRASQHVIPVLPGSIFLRQKNGQVWTLPAPTLLGKLDLLRQSWRLNKVLDEAAELRSKIKDGRPGRPGRPETIRACPIVAGVDEGRK